MSSEGKLSLTAEKREKIGKNYNLKLRKNLKLCSVRTRY